MFHSPYCFLSKLTIQNPICKKVPIFSLSLLFSFKTNYSEHHLQKSSHFFTLLIVFFQKITIQNLIRKIASTRLPFRCNICQNFMQISIILLPI